MNDIDKLLNRMTELGNMTNAQLVNIVKAINPKIRAMDIRALRKGDLMYVIIREEFRRFIIGVKS